jgi:hypothetical protein
LLSNGEWEVIVFASYEAHNLGIGFRFERGKYGCKKCEVRGFVFRDSTCTPLPGADY